MGPRHARRTLFPYTTLFRSDRVVDDLPDRAVARLGGSLVDRQRRALCSRRVDAVADLSGPTGTVIDAGLVGRSEEHTSELQSHSDVVCGLLLDRKKR